MKAPRKARRLAASWHRRAGARLIRRGELLLVPPATRPKDVAVYGVLVGLSTEPVQEPSFYEWIEREGGA
jgi:hypothetical protein